MHSFSFLFRLENWLMRWIDHISREILLNYGALCFNWKKSCQGFFFREIPINQCILIIIASFRIACSWLNLSLCFFTKGCFDHSEFKLFWLSKEVIDQNEKNLINMLIIVNNGWWRMLTFAKWRLKIALTAH